MVTGRQPPVKATCFAGGYSLLFQIFWLRVSQGQIDGLLTLEMLNLLLQFWKNNFTYDENVHDEYYKIACEAIAELYPQLPFVIEDMKQGYISPHADLEKIALFFAHMLLILGISFGNTDVDTFWAKRNVTEMQERVHCLVAHYDTIICRGPLVCMAVMAKIQTGPDENRGLYKDCLHAMYVPYCGVFFTNDKHFLRLKEQQPEAVFGRINSIDMFCKDLFEKVIPQLNKSQDSV